MASDAEHPFICLWTLRMSSLEKCLFKSFAHFLIGLLVFFEWSLVSSLYILKIRPLSEVSLANMFSHTLGSLFILILFSLAMHVEEGLEKWIVVTHGSGERKGNKGRVVHPDMTGKLAWRLILEAHHQELNNRACSLKFARGIEQPWLCIHMSLKLLGVYAIDNNCFLLWMPCYPPSFFSYSINMMRKPSSGLFSLMLLSPLFLILSSTSAITLCSPPFTLQHMQKLFILMRSNLFILSFVSLALGDISVKILLCEISEIFLPIF